MTLQTLPTSIVYPGLGFSNNSTSSFSASSTLDAAGEYLAFIFRAKEAMTISHVYMKCNTATGSPTAVIRIETVDGTTGLPTGTLWATNTSVTTATLTTTGTVHALTASASVSAGSYVAVKIGYNSGTSFTLALNRLGRLAQTSLPYLVTNTGTPTKSAVLGGACYAVGVGSSSTSFYNVSSLFMPITSATQTGSVSTSTYDAIGTRFKVPFTCRCTGLITQVNTSSFGEFTYGIYNDAGTELSSSNTTGFDADLVGDQGNGVQYTLYFDNPVTLTADTWYRAALLPTSTTAFVVHVYGAIDAYTKAVLPGGTNWHYTRKNVGAGWDDTYVNEAFVMNLILDQLDDGVGGGGGGFSASWS